MEQQVSLPLLEAVIPGGLRFGANYLVEFEPQSLWYEASLTLCAQALRKGIRTDYHTFTHPPEDIRSALTRMGINLEELEGSGVLRVIDSFTIQTGIGKSGSAGIATFASVNTRSLKMSDWDRFNAEILKKEVPAEDLQRLHIDDDTSVLFQYNDEDSVVEHFRTQTTTFARKLKLSAIHAIKAGIYSENSYRRFESFCDGIVDFRAQEQQGKMVHSMRVRLARGAKHDSAWRDIELEGSGEVVVTEGMHKPKSPDTVDIPFFRDLIPGGIEYGSVLLVEFEPQSCWYEASYTMAAQALRNGLKTDLHVFQHNPKAVRDAIRRFGFDMKKLEDEDLLRFIDSYSVQIGVNKADVPKGADAFKTSSVKLEDWARAAAAQMSTEIPDSERNRVHIDDNTAILSRYNKEDELIDYWRTKIIPLYRAREGVLVNAVALGVASDWFYKQHESMVDGIIDCRSVEENGVVQHYVRVRAFRGKSPDSRWQRIKVVDGEVVFEGSRRGGEFAGPGEGERRLAAIMFTDMVGFTGMAQRNEVLAMELLEEQRDLMRPFFLRHRGREVKTIGDAFLVEFPSALEAVRCAVGIQEALNVDNASRTADRKLAVRIGVHLGDVIHNGTDVAGDAVNVASRIEPLAPSGGVSVSGQVYESVVNKIEEEFELMGMPQLKNVATQVAVYRVKGLGDAPAQVQARPKPGPPSDRIAVLPFSNISQDVNDEYFADGMTEELISALSRTRGLRVIARTSVMRFKGTKKAISEIGRELDVGSVLEGSVRKSGNRLRVTVQLVETSNEEPKWSEEYDRELRDVFAIQGDIAQKVADALRELVLGIAPAPEVKATNTEAYVYYLRGRQEWNKRTQEGLNRAFNFFEEALKKDPGYAKAYTGLADACSSLALLEFMPPNEAYPKAKEAVARALALDDRLAEAHTSLALIRFQYDWDWKGAEEEFREAIAINPSYAPAHHFFADYLKAMGRFDEALVEIYKAHELDPLSLAINTGVGHVLYLSGQYDKAIDQYRKAVDLDPSFMATHVWFGRPYLEKGMYNEAISELETAVKLSGESTLALAMLGHGLASAGRNEEAEQVLKKLKERAETQYVPSYWIAVVYNGFREKEQVLFWMKKAYEERSSWLVWSNVEPRFAWVRGDPEFAALMAAMKFPRTSFNR